MLTQPQAQPSSSSSSDLGSLTSGSVQRVLIKTKLPVVRAGAASIAAIGYSFFIVWRTYRPPGTSREKSSSMPSAAA